MKNRSDLSLRASRSQRELHSDSKTVRYELEMLLGAASQYGTATAQGNVISSNAHIESFAVHCRALILFLYGHLDKIAAPGLAEGFAALRPTDVLAYDFDVNWPINCPPPTALLVEAKRQADKYVAHITTHRRDVNQPGSSIESIWKLDATSRALVAVMGCFLSTVPVSQIDPSECRRMRVLTKPWLALPATKVLAVSRPSPFQSINLHGRTA